MRAHQAASSASSAREKWMRPLVVGPSPVMTPSRTMVRAWAAVVRQVGDSAPGNSAGLVRGADIIPLLSFCFLVCLSGSFLGQHFHAGVNEWLTIRNRGFDIFRWLPICRFSAVGGSRRPATGPGVLGVIRGENGADGLTRRTIFRRRGAHEKKVLEPYFCGEGFHL